MAQQTAVEYFDEQIQEYVIAADHIARVLVIQISFEEYMDIKSKAKQMEREQIVRAYNSYYTLGEFVDGDYLKGEQYYEQTYGK